MSLKQNIQQDLEKALKDGQTIAVSTLRLVFASVLNKEKEKRFKISREPAFAQGFSEAREKELEEKSALSDEEIIDVIFSEIKKRKDAIVLYEKGGRQELADKEKAESEVLQKYLPEQISEEDLKKIVAEAIEKTGAKEIKDTGKIMAQVMPKVKGRADGAKISKIVKELLT